MTSVLLQLLGVACLATSVAVLAVLLLRGPLRRAAGAAAAYQLWWTVAAALLVACLPLARAASSAAVVSAPVAVGITAVASTSKAVTAALPQFPLLAIWLIGVFVHLVALAVLQRRFRRGLGLGITRGRIAYADGGPCLLGLLRPRIVLPRDFHQQYDAGERRLILAHEIVHLRRGDLLVNAIALLLRCVFWFNPLLHFAAARLRQDQELACDARVASRFPQARRRYAGALLKAQLGGVAASARSSPLGCGWRSDHPLKERITMLKCPQYGNTRRRSGSVAAALVSLLLATAVWAAKPAAPPVSTEAAYVDAQIRLRIDGGAEQNVRMVHPFGERFLVTTRSGKQHWQAEFVATAKSADTILLVATIRSDDRVVATPSILLRDGESGGLAVEGGNGAGALQLDAILQRNDKPLPRDG